MKRLETVVNRKLLDKNSNCCWPLLYKSMLLVAYFVDGSWVKLSRDGLRDLWLTAGERCVRVALLEDADEGDDDETTESSVK